MRGRHVEYHRAAGLRRIVQIRREYVLGDRRELLFINRLQGIEIGSAESGTGTRGYDGAALVEQNVDVEITHIGLKHAVLIGLGEPVVVFLQSLRGPPAHLFQAKHGPRVQQRCTFGDTAIERVRGQEIVLDAAGQDTQGTQRCRQLLREEFLPVVEILNSRRQIGELGTLRFELFEFRLHLVCRNFAVVDDLLKFFPIEFVQRIGEVPQMLQVTHGICFEQREVELIEFIAPCFRLILQLARGCRKTPDRLQQGRQVHRFLLPDLHQRKADHSKHRLADRHDAADRADRASGACPERKRVSVLDDLLGPLAQLCLQNADVVFEIGHLVRDRRSFEPQRRDQRVHRLVLVPVIIDLVAQCDPRFHQGIGLALQRSGGVLNPVREVENPDRPIHLVLEHRQIRLERKHWDPTRWIAEEIKVIGNAVKYGRQFILDLYKFQSPFGRQCVPFGPLGIRDQVRLVLPKHLCHLVAIPIEESIPRIRQDTAKCTGRQPRQRVTGDRTCPGTSNRHICIGRSHTASRR